MCKTQKASLCVYILTNESANCTLTLRSNLYDLFIVIIGNERIRIIADGNDDRAPRKQNARGNGRRGARKKRRLGAGGGGGSGGRRLLAFQQDERRFLPAKHRPRVRLLHPLSWNAPKIDRVWGAILQPTVLPARGLRFRPFVSVVVLPVPRGE